MLSVWRNRNFKTVCVPLLHFFLFQQNDLVMHRFSEVSLQLLYIHAIRRAATLHSHNPESVGDLRWLAGHTWTIPVCSVRAGAHSSVFPFPVPAVLIGCFGLGGVGAESWPLITGHRV